MPNSKSPKNRKNHLLFLLISAAAVLLVMAGQLLLYSYPMDPSSFIPWAMVLGAAGVTLFLWNRARNPFPFDDRKTARSRIPGSLLLIAAAVVLTVTATVTMVLFQRFGRTNFLPVLTLWLGAGGCYLAAFVPSLGPVRQADIRAWFDDHWKECLGIGLITAAAAVMRFYQLGNIPRVINGDEGWIGKIAETTTALPYANPFALWENFGGLYLQTINWAFKFFGTNPFALRLLPAVAGTLAVPALYLLARQIAGKRAAFIAAFLLAASHTHINFSRTVGVGYIQDTWLVPLELYLFLSGLEKNKLWRTALAGVILGIHFSIYLTPQIFTGALLIFTILVALFYRRKYPGVIRAMLPLWGGLAVMILPEAVFALSHPNEFFTRLNVDGSFQSGWLVKQMAATGQNAVQVLGGRVLHAFLSLIYYPAIDFYGSLIPVLSLFSSILFLIGLGLSLSKTRKIGFLLLNGYFWAGIVAIGVFSIPETADTYRVLMILPAAMLMAGIGLDEILESFGLGWDRRKAAYAAAAAFLLANLFVFNQWAYFVDFAGQCRYGGDLQTRFASYAGKYLKTVPREITVYLLSDDVYSYGTHASSDFLSDQKTVINFPGPVDTIPFGSEDIIIATPNRLAELAAWAHDRPVGKLVYIYDCDKPILSYYRVP
jgi:4-amino-4-deoxy-L-arabinose transferase-like glycosyltransferase